MIKQDVELINAFASSAEKLRQTIAETKRRGELVKAVNSRLQKKINDLKDEV